ncbi:hypothetical protein GIB67_007891 [Kingdonia uniflora]|uniref:AUGMIN subunit 8 n=1 Tax=Kingdonia uniflora TaxID=39325 RepID=A0A7J7PBF2_9MAGN|nr:hypothetical protein GIB67_007891 [Kingdonia uniflora]
MVWMDVYEAEQALKKGVGEDSVRRRPLVPSEKNNAITRKPRTTREVPSRYKASINSSSIVSTTPVVSRRSPSPNVARTLSQSPPLVTKRSQSAERRHSVTATPVSTPVQDTNVEAQSPSKRAVSARTPEGLWPKVMPSSMRSLSVSFQSDTFSLPVTKREKPINHASSDHPLKPSANAIQRKVTPERKRTPLRGRNASDHSENSKPMDNTHSRVLDHHRWPKVSAGSLNRSMDLMDKSQNSTCSPVQGRGVSPLRRPPSSLQKSQSKVASQITFDQSGRAQYEKYVGASSCSSERPSSTARTTRSQFMPFVPGSPRTPSPTKASLSRGMISPSRTRQTIPFPSASPISSRPDTSSSVLSFIADIKKGKKGVNHIEDAHQLRLLYNRYFQWRYANAQAESVLSIQNLAAENTIYSVWNTTFELRDSVVIKRINLQQLRQELKLNIVLNEQIAYLDDWALLEKEHLTSISGATEALEACTLRLPVTSGARADMDTLKKAICSAVDVMQTMASSICSLLSRAEGTNCLVSELANVTAQERALLDECGDLLASTAAVQVQQYMVFVADKEVIVLTFTDSVLRMVKTRWHVYEERVSVEVQRLKLRYIGNQALKMPMPIPVPSTYHGMTEDEATDTEDDYYQMWRF